MKKNKLLLYVSLMTVLALTGLFVLPAAGPGRVLSYDHSSDSLAFREYGGRTLLRGEGFRLTLSNGKTLKRLRSHPVWIVGEGWKTWEDSPDSFAPGKSVLFLDGSWARPVPIKAASEIGALSYRTYVNVQGTHSYFASGVLVHNCSPIQIPGGPPGGQMIDCKSSSCPTSSSYIPPAGGGGPSSDPQPCVKCGKISCICDDYQDAAVDKVETAAEEAQAAVERAEEEQAAAGEEIEETAAVNESPQTGDPVLTSTGIYVMAERDLAVARTYRSGSRDPGRPSGGWFYGIDSRMLRGIDHGARGAADALGGYLAEIDAALADYTKYGGSSHSEEYVAMSRSRSEVQALHDAYKARADRAAGLSALNGVLPLRGIDPALQHAGNDTLVWIDESGSPSVFDPDQGSAGVWLPRDPSMRGVRILSVDGKNSLDASGFRLMDRNGTVREFDRWGLPTLTREIRGKFLRWKRDAATRRVTSLSNDHGAVWTLSYTSFGELKGIEGPLGQRVSYVHEWGPGFRILAAVTDADGDTVRYGYDGKGRLKRIQKADAAAPGDSCVEIAYGEETAGGALVTETRHEEGGSETFGYFPGLGMTSYTNHSGLTAYHYYDPSHRPLKDILPDGSVIEYVWDPSTGKLEREFRYDSRFPRPASPSVRYEYEAERLNRVRAVYGDSSYEAWRWNRYDQMVYYRDRDGAESEWVYDDRGNLTESWRRVNGTKTRTYWASYSGTTGKLYQDRTGDQAVWTYQWNAETGFPSSRSAAIGGSTVTESWSYDILGRPLSFTDGESRMTSWEYLPKTEELPRRTRVTTPEGLRTTRHFNERKDLILIEEEDLRTGISRQTGISYDRRHLPLTVTDGSGFTKTYEYRDDGKLLSETSGPWSTNYAYDKDTGELASLRWRKEERDGSGEIVSVSQRALSFSSSRDASGYLTRRTLSPNPDTAPQVPATVATSHAYDPWDRIVAVTGPDNQSYSRRLSPAGRVIAEQTSFGGWVGYEWDGAGLVSKAGRVGAKVFTSINDPATAVYNPDGSVKRRIDREGLVTNYEYDGRGLLLREYTAAGEKSYRYDRAGRLVRSAVKTATAEAAGHGETFTTWTWNDAARTVTVSEGGLYTVHWTLDAWGNPLRKTDFRNASAAWSYDGAGRLESETDQYGAKTRYQWNELGKIASVTRPDGSFETFAYDESGNLAAVKDNLGAKWLGTYNRAGLLAHETGRPGIDRSYRYDSLGRLTSVSVGGTETERYAYSDLGRTVIYNTGGASSVTYRKNAYGELISETNRLGNVQSYTYDDEGVRRGQTSYSSRKTSVETDWRTLTTVTKSGTQTLSTVVRDYSGRVIRAAGPSGTIRYRYDAGGRMVSQTDEEAGETTSWTYDGGGRRLTMTSGNRSLRYAYGLAGELQSATDSLRRLTVSFAYDAALREASRRYGNGVTQKTDRDAIGRTVMIRELSPTGSLLRAEAYLYDPQGRRYLTVNESGAVTRYEYDGQSRLSSAVYPYGDDLSRAAKKEAEDLGLSLSTASGRAETLAFAAEEYAALRALLDGMAPFRSNLLKPSFQRWRETYAYDARGNRSSKTTPWGAINYAYDDENRLVRAGSTSFAYDGDGNLLSESGLRKSASYTYNAYNRMETSTVTLKDSKVRTSTRYGYDAFGRRTLTQDAGGSLMRTLYDGLSLEVIRESPAFDDGSFAVGLGNSISWGSDGSAFAGSTRGRYAWIEDEPSGRAALPDGEAYRRADARFTGERTPLYARGESVAVSRSPATSSRGGIAYFGSDILGSLRSVTDEGGSLETRCEYDAFGSPYAGDFASGAGSGYTGKTYDPVTGLYDYGFRDYSPSTARFTTSDPIRDGRNWFSYVNNDPVNFTDPFGLTSSDAQAAVNALVSVGTDVRIDIYRNPNSYLVTQDRNNPQNAALDVLVITKQSTGEQVVINHVQTVSNYPLTKPDGTSAGNNYGNTLAVGSFQLEAGAATSVAAGGALIVVNAKTVDGRTVGTSGTTPDSNERHLEHSNTNPETGLDYNTPYGKGCIIPLSGSDNTKIHNTLSSMGISSGTRIDASIHMMAVHGL